MAETADTISTTVSPPPESEASSTFPSSTDQTSDEASKTTDLTKETSPEKKAGGISLRIWPPTEKTRDAVLARLIETLSTESILSKRYGTLEREEAIEIAKSIEEKAYGVASEAGNADDDGIEILQIYSKEISKQMLDTVKDRSKATETAGNGTESKNESVEDAAEVTKDDAEPEPAKSEA